MVTAGVGLNMISHLVQSMDQFAPDVDESGVAHPALSSFDWFAFSFILCAISKKINLLIRN